MHDPMPEPWHPETAAHRTLVVEDVPVMRFYLRAALERAGVVVTVAANLREARQALRQTPDPTCVILDLELPDGDGLELLPDIPPGVPIAALTADDSPQTALRCRAAGCSKVIYKGDVKGAIASVVQRLEHREQTVIAPIASDNELTRRYLNYLIEAGRELREAFLQHDLASMRRLAHRLQGTAVLFGYPEVGASARALGLAIGVGSPDQLAASFHTLNEQLRRALATKRPRAGSAVQHGQV